MSACFSIKLDSVAEWCSGFETNSDRYGRRCYTYAMEWASLMERLMAEGKPLAEIYESASFEADTDGISGHMHWQAVRLLCRCWQHGDALCQLVEKEAVA